MAEQGLNWGLMSTARINRRLIPAIRAAERSELVAVASRALGRAEEFAAKWGIARAYGSYEAMLEAPDVHAVYVPLPNSLHAEWTVKAAEAGKHVLCEKPIAITLDEVDKIIAAAEANQVVVAEAVMYLYHPLLYQAREMVRAGAIGELRLIRGAFSIQMDRPGDVRYQPELGGGSLWDVGSYPVSFIRWLAGEPAEVFGWQVIGETGVDVGFAGLLRCEGQVLGLFDSGFGEPYRVDAEVVGSEGMLRLERPYVMNEESSLVLVREDEAELVEVSTIDPYRCEVEAVAAAALDGSPLPVTLSQSRQNVATLLALYSSARLGAPVTMGERPGTKRNKS